MRPSLTQQLGGYNQTFPDRYFMGINAIVVVITLVSTSSLLGSSKLIIKFSAAILLTALIIMYGKSAPWIFETYETRMPLMVGASFSDQLCESGKDPTKSVDGLIVVPIYFEGWSISIPSQILLAATEKLDCHALRPMDINDANWNRGVARNWSGLVLASYASADLLRDRKAIRFANGEIRFINRVEMAGRYTNVFLDGGPLDGERVGYPNKFEVIE